MTCHRNPPLSYHNSTVQIVIENNVGSHLCCVWCRSGICSAVTGHPGSYWRTNIVALCDKHCSGAMPVVVAASQ